MCVALHAVEKVYFVAVVATDVKHAIVASVNLEVQLYGLGLGAAAEQQNGRYDKRVFHSFFVLNIN